MVFNGEKIKAIRENKGLTVREMAEYTGYSERQLYRIEGNQGKKDISLMLANKICEFLGCYLEDICEDGIELV